MRFKEYKCGCLSSPIDERDYNIHQLVQCAVRLPMSYVSNYDIQILDQGSSSMCVACAVSQAKHIIEQKQTNDKNMFSPAYIYSNRKESDYKGEGMIPREALKSLKDNGVCHMHDFVGMYSYNEAKAIYDKRKDELDKKAIPYRISSYYKLNNIDEIKEAIYTIGFALVSYNVYDSLYYPINGNVLYDPNDKNSHGGHMMIAIGWDDDKNGGSLVVANSWGKDYGDKGICYIPYEYTPKEAWALVDDIIEKDIKETYNRNNNLFIMIVTFIKKLFSFKKDKGIKEELK